MKFEGCERPASSTVTPLGFLSEDHMSRKSNSPGGDVGKLHRKSAARVKSYSPLNYMPGNYPSHKAQQAREREESSAQQATTKVSLRPGYQEQPKTVLSCCYVF